MKRVILSISCVFLLSSYQPVLAQYYSRGDWMSDKPYQDMLNDKSINNNLNLNGGFSGSSSGIQTLDAWKNKVKYNNNMVRGWNFGGGWDIQNSQTVFRLKDNGDTGSPQAAFPSKPIPYKHAPRPAFLQQNNRDNAQTPYLKGYEYSTPEVVYYSPSSYFVMGTSESQDDPWLDRFEQQIDVWREAGEQKVLSYVGDKLIGFARKTISSSSAMGAQIVKVYDVVNDIAGVKNLEMNIINRNLDAVRSSVKTGNPRSVNEANQKTQQVVIDHRNTYMANKGLISPSPKQIDKKGQNVTKEVAETATEKWIQSRSTKH